MAMCCSCLPCASWCRAGLRPTGQGLDVTDALNPRTRMLLEAPIAPTLLRLAAPNVLVMLAQAGVSGQEIRTMTHDNPRRFFER